MEHEISSVAALLAERARAAMLVALLDGSARAAGELARVAGISAQSASNHLHLLRQEDLLQVEQQGRNRFYRLHRPEVAEAVEALAALTPLRTAKRIDGPDDRALRVARHCYSHLAGRLAVEIFERFEARGFLSSLDQKFLSMTPEGRKWFEGLGIDSRLLSRNGSRVACRCLDWTERKHHLAGRLGVAFFHWLIESGWLKPVRNSRAMRVTQLGCVELEKRLGVFVSGS